MTKLFLPLSCVLLLLTSCSESSAPVAKKEPEKPPEPIGGQSALYKMYQVARTWAPDIQVLKLNSIVLTEVPKVPPDKAAGWEVVFTSAERSRARSYTYCVVESEGNLHKGVFAGPEQAWTGPTGDSAPFPIMAVKIETDAAYQTALKQAAEYEKKHPNMPMTWLLEKESKHPDPVWRVIWGESVGTSDFSILVDASTGEFTERLH